jgi:hypothetical protein
MLNFIAKFAAIGFAVAIVGAVLGLDGASLAARQDLFIRQAIRNVQGTGAWGPCLRG